MDSVTHALVAVLLFHAPFPGWVVVFAILGATLPDIDVFLKRISDRDPRLYIFSHGGFTHSIPGTLAVSTGIVLGFIAWQYSLNQVLEPSLLSMAFGLAFAGALTHIVLDALAFPGIPLLYPATSRKYSAGIFLGPSLVFLAVSIGFLVMYLIGYIGIPALSMYGIFGVVYILVHLLLKVFIAANHEGMTIPTINPLKWLVIRESRDSYQVYYTGLRTRRSNMKVFARYEGVDRGFLNRHLLDPEMQRLAYYSYITVAGREGEVVVVYDPIREEGLLYYPPSYTRVRLPWDGGGTADTPVLY